MKRVLASLVLLASGCFSPNADLSDEMPDDLPAGACRDTDPDDCATSTGFVSSGGTSEGTSTGAPADGCAGSESCLGDGVCVAAWDADAQARGSFECQFACVPVLDETTWCSDDASCCDTGTVCTARGYCVYADDTGTSGSSTGGSTG